MARADTPFMDFDFAKMFNPSKMLTDFQFNGLDVDAVLAGQRRNLEAITAANQAALNGFQALTQRQTEMLRQAVEEITRAVKEMLAAGSPEEKATRQAELAKHAFQRAVANTRELAELVAKSQTEAFGLLQRRVSEGFDEVKTYIAKRAAKNGRVAA